MSDLTRRSFLAFPVAAAIAASCRRQGPPFVESDFRVPNRSAVGCFPRPTIPRISPT